MADFKVGGRVLCIRTHSKGRFKKGDIFTVSTIKKSCCSCSSFLLEFEEITMTTTYCIHCNTDLKGSFYKSISFIPLGDDADLSDTTVEELLEELTEF